MTELGEIPEEWEVNSIGELVKTLKSGLSRSLKDENVGIPCIRSNNIKDNRLVLDDLKYWYKVDDKGANIDDYILKNGDIIINFINSVAQIGKGCIFNSELRSIYTTNLLRIQTDENKINNKFFYYYTLSERYKNEVGVITKPAVNQASFTTVEYKAIKFPVPPLKEQEKIASILSTVDEQIDEVDGLIEKNKELKKGLMQQLLTKGIGHTKFKKSEIGEIPEEWEVKTMTDIIETTQLGTNTLGSEDESGIPMLKMGNLTIGGFSFEKVEYITQQEFESNKEYVLRDGDFLFNTRNTLELVGKSATWNGKLDVAIFNSNIMRIKYTKEINSFYMGYYFSSDIGWKELKAIATGTTSVAAIYTKDLMKIKVIVPTIEEQEKISSILSSVDLKIEEYETKKQKLEELKKGLMQQLLTGKIRVI